MATPGLLKRKGWIEAPAEVEPKKWNRRGGTMKSLLFTICGERELDIEFSIFLPIYSIVG